MVLGMDKMLWTVFKRKVVDTEDHFDNSNKYKYNKFVTKR
jgi:hypothetical protein